MCGGIYVVFIVGDLIGNRDLLARYTLLRGIFDASLPTWLLCSLSRSVTFLLEPSASLVAKYRKVVIFRNE